MTFKQTAIDEARELAIITGYLWICLGTIVLFKSATLREYGVAPLPLGFALVKALVLAKFIMIGDVLKIGERYRSEPLIWPVAYRSVAFVALLAVLTAIEEVIVGLFHHRTVGASLGDLFGRHLDQTLVGYLIMLLVLIPFFAIRELSVALPEGLLRRLFFVSRSA
jgi:hypothetical protein